MVRNCRNYFLRRLRTLEIEREIVNKPSKKGNSFFLPKSNSYASVNSRDISYNQLPSSTSSCPQNLGHDSFVISEEIEALNEIINQSLQCITRDPPKEWVSIETQTGDVSFAAYVDSEYVTNNDLFVMVASKGTVTDSGCHQLATSINVNKDRIEQNRDELELTNNVKDKNTNDKINESSKSSVATNRDRSGNVNNTPSDI